MAPPRSQMHGCDAVAIIFHNMRFANPNAPTRSSRGPGAAGLLSEELNPVAAAFLGGEHRPVRGFDKRICTSRMIGE